ncbi:MAG: DUF3631 domain-containing protein [Planctomycetes bacterium]|nr:DUF3631 domain-containing protein [Planctomycetota bacterium]
MNFGIKVKPKTIPRCLLTGTPAKPILKISPITAGATGFSFGVSIEINYWQSTHRQRVEAGEKEREAGEEKYMQNPIASSKPGQEQIQLRFAAFQIGRGVRLGVPQAEAEAKLANLKAQANGKGEILHRLFHAAFDGAGEDELVDGILFETGFFDLPLNPSNSEIEMALRTLALQLADPEKPIDVLRRETIRRAAIQRLDKLGVKGAVRLVDAALANHAAASKTAAGQGQTVAFRDPEPWTEPVDGAELLAELVAVFERYLVLPRRSPETLALWTIHTWALDAADISPRLAITSPTKRCGKTRVLEILAALVCRALPSSNVTSATVYRMIEKYYPTLLIDEVDTFLEEKNELRGILNSGHSRTTAFVPRCVGEEHEVRLFSTWAAMATACIGNLPSTLADRSIGCAMKRKSASEKVARLRIRDLEPLTAPMRRKCARWAADNLEALKMADTETPPELDDRAADNWTPLLAIADLAGGAWPRIARLAAIELSAGREEAEGDTGLQLFQDLNDLFQSQKLNPRSMTVEILEALTGLDGRP